MEGGTIELELGSRGENCPLSMPQECHAHASPRFFQDQMTGFLGVQQLLVLAYQILQE